MSRDIHKEIMRAAREGSGAAPGEFEAAMLGVLAAEVDVDTWANAAHVARDCFRGRRRA